MRAGRRHEDRFLSDDFATTGMSDRSSAARSPRRNCTGVSASVWEDLDPSSMAHYLFYFSKKGAARGITLREQAANLLKVRMWGIGAKTLNRLSLVPEDRVLIYVGAPEYQFIG